MEKTLQRLLSFVLAVLMVVSCVPTSAIATEVGSEDSSYEEIVGDDEYVEEEEDSEPYVGEGEEDTEPEDTEPEETVDYEAVAALEDMIYALPASGDLAGYDLDALEAITEDFMDIEDAYSYLNDLSKAEVADAWSSYQAVKAAWEVAYDAIQEEPIDDLAGEEEQAGDDNELESSFTHIVSSEKELAEAVTTGGEVILDANITLTDALVIPYGVKVVLDLSGYSISQQKYQTAGYSMIVNNGDLTIVDATHNSHITYTDTGVGGEYVSNTIMNQGNLTVKGGIIENLSSPTVAKNGYPYAIDTGIWGTASEVNVVVEDGMISCPSYTAIRVRGDSATKPVNVTIEYGMIQGAIEVQNSSNVAAGKLTVTGGNFFNTQSIRRVLFVFGSNGSTSMKIDISGGNWYGDLDIRDTIGAGFNKAFISGGNFTADPSAYLVNGYETTQDQNGYTVIKSTEPDTPPAVEIPAGGVEVKGEISEDKANALVNEIQSNSQAGAVEELPTTVNALKISFIEVSISDNVPTQLVFKVTPVDEDGEKVSTPGEAITFRLPIPAVVQDAYAKVFHGNTPMGTYKILTENNEKYVEVSSANFSEFTVVPTAEAPVTAVVKIGEIGYATLDAALAAAKEAGLTKVEITVLDDIIFSTAVGDFTKVTFNGTNREQTIDMNLKAAVDVNTELVFNNLTVSRLDGDWLYHYTYVHGGLTYNNCKMVGLFNVTAQDTVFNRCDFYNDNTFGDGNYSIWLYNCFEGVEVSITKCTFDVYERAIKIYGNGYNGVMTLNISGTKFTSRTADKTVVEMAYSNSTGNGSMNLNITDSTATGFGAPEHIEGAANAWFNVEGTNTVSTVKVDNEVVYTDVKPAGPVEIDLSQSSYTITEAGEYTVKGVETQNTLSVDAEGNVTITLNGVTINAPDGDSAISIEKGNVTLFSAGAANTLNGGDNGAGIYVDANASLTIKGDEMLTATGNNRTDDTSGAAGIGGAYGKGASGEITIDGASVTAKGYGVWASGIGSAGGYAADITIKNGANVVAEGGYYANGKGTQLQTSYGKSDPEGGAAIGGGSKSGAGVGKITITDSTVKAYGGSKAAGIGAMFWNSVEAIAISGTSDVTAQGGSSSAAIGTSRAGTGVSANITISGGTVTATGGAYGSGIGSGYNADSLGNGAATSALPVTNITITGGAVIATGGEGGAAIGGGYKSDNVNIDITGCAVTATAGKLVEGKTVENGGAPAAIGSGANGSGKFENSPAAEVASSATVTVTAYEDGKPAIEGMTNEQTAAMNNVTLNEILNPNKVYVAQIGDKKYETLAEALNAAKTMTGDVTVEIYDKVTLNAALTGSFDSIKFVGKDDDAEVYLDVQGYITATGKKVAFEGLTLSKSAGGYIDNAGFMNLAFGVFDVLEVTYTDCVFANGAYASSGKVTFDGCTFYRSHDRYGMWVYGAVEAIVDGCTFPDIRGIKLYSEGLEKSGDLTVKNTDFSAATGKPAIVLTSGKSVTLEGNTYPTTGVFELDLAGVPNGTPITSDVLPICINDNGACGVLVDGKIYTTVAQAAEVAASGSTVTLLHNSAETVELPEGVTLDKNGFTADGVTVKAAAPTGSNSYAYTKEVDGYVRVWGEGGGNASESYALKLYSGETLIATTVLNNIGGIIDGDVNVTWNFYYPESNDEYWTTTWEEGHPNSAAQPTKVELIIDGTVVATTDAKMSGADDVNPVVWKNLGGVKYVCTGLEGEGTEASPYLINNLEELAWFRDDVNAGNTYAGKFVKLTTDINLNVNRAAVNWEPIGTASNPFKGTFDGGNFTVSNLVVDGGNNAGFFGYADSCTIKNLKIVNANVKGVDCVGAIAGQVYSVSTIDNCHVSGLIKIEGQTNVGGIVGKYYTKVTDSSVIGDGTATSYVMGTYTASDLEGDNVGGIMGHCGEDNNLSGNTVKNITIVGTRKVGGIVGIADQNTNVTGCTVENVVVKTNATAEYAASKVTSMSIGGLIGQFQKADTTVDGNVSNNTISGVSFVIPEGVVCEAGAIVGGARGGSTGMLAPSDKVVASGNTIATVTGATNDYLIPATVVTSLDELTAALSAGSKKIQVSADITVDAEITIPEGVSVSIDEGKTLRVLSTLTNNGTINGNGTVSVDVMVKDSKTVNGAIAGTAPECAVAYAISLDGGNTWINDTNKGKTQAVIVKTDGSTVLYTSFQTAFGAAKTGEIVHMLTDAHVQSTNPKKNNGPLRSYYGLILEGNGHTIFTDLESSGASNEYATIKFTSYLAGTGPQVNPVLRNVTIDSQNNAKADLDVVSGDVTFTVTMENVNLLGKCQNASFPIKSSSLIVNKSNLEIYDCSIPSWDAGSANAINIYSGSYSLSLNGKCTVYGGTYTKDVTNYLAEGYALEKNADGKYVVSGPYAAEVNGERFKTLAEAAAAVTAGDEIIILTDNTPAENVTLPAGVILNGNGKVINGAITAGGDLTFKGATTVTNFSAGYYNNTITIGADASLKVTGGRLTVSYGNIFNITGSITDAATADKANLTPSLELVGGISFTGNGNGVQFNVTNAYVVLGNSTTKDKDATGEFNVNFNNSIVDFTNNLNTVAPTYDTLKPVFKLTATDSVVNIKSNMELKMDNTIVTLDNTTLTIGSSFANYGTVNVENGSYMLVKTPIMSSHGGNYGTINIKGGTLELADSNQDWENAGTIHVTAPGKLITNDFKNVGEGKIVVDGSAIAFGESATVVDGNGVYNFEATTEVKGTMVTASFDNGDIVLTRATPAAQVGDAYYATVLEAMTAAIEAGASEVKILTDVCEVMTSDFDLKINADLTITAEQPVKVEFYNENGTTRDFAVGSTNNNTLTIGKNVHFDLTDRVIWLGFWGNNVDVVVEGYLGGYQIWHGADTTVSSTGTLDSHGEAFVMRRDATLTVNGGKVKANYFQIYSGHIVAKDATITAGLVWINNNHASLGGEGTVSMTLDNTTFTSNGEFKAYAGEGKTVDITLTNGSSVTAAGALTTDAATTIMADATSSFTSNNKSVFVAETEGYQFTSLQAAVDAAPAGATVNLTADVNVGAGLIVNAPATTFAATSETGITLDLAGYDIVGTTNAITNNGTLTIEDSVGTGNVYTTDVAAQGRAAVVNNGTLVIKGGWFGDSNNDTTDRNAINRGNALKNYGEATINGGYFTNVSNQYIGTDAYAYAINNLTGGTTTINNATVYGDINGLIYSDGKTVVNDGSFTLGRPNEENNLWYLAFGDVEIKGGTWNRAFKVPSWNTGDPTFQGNVAVSGGTFNIDVEEKYCAEGYIPTDNGNGTYGVRVGSYVAQVNGVKYETLEEAFKAATANCTIEILADVTIDYDWDARYTGAKFTVPVTIDGNGHTLTFTAKVYDGGNFLSAFRFEADATVKDLTVDMTNAVSGFAGRFRAISAKGNLTVDGCTFIGNGSANNTRAIIFGEGSDANVGNLTISITDSTFTGWRRGVTDNENGQDVKSVTVNGNTFTDADVYVSASESITFNNNEMDNSWANLSTYAEVNGLTVNASGNTLAVNTETKYNYVEAKTANVQDGFVVAVTGLKGSGTAEDPFLINNLDELKWFRDHVNTFAQDGSSQYTGMYIKLTADINLDEDGDGIGEEWEPIGSTTADHGSFYGIFDGDGHTIYNLVVSKHGTGSGFFAKTSGGGDGPQAVIRNITFHNVNVNAGNNASYAGGVIANAGGNSVVSNVHVTGNVYVNGYGYVGGIIGHGYPKIDKCSVVAEEGSYVHANYWCGGGIIGYAGEGGTSITNSSVSGIDIWSAYGGAGAVAGLLQYGNKLENVSASNVEITSNSDYAMGYIAGNGEESTLTKVTAFNVTATANGNEITSTDAVAKVDGAVYFSLADAMAAAENGDTVTLLTNITLTEGVTVAKGNTVTLDLNGKTVSAELAELPASFALITNKGTLTVKDTASGGELSVNYTGESWGYGKGLYTISNEGGTLNIEGGRIENLTTVTGSMYDAIDNNSTLGDTVLNISGGEIYCDYLGIRQFANSTTAKNTVNVTDGKIEGGNCSIWTQNPNSKQNNANVTITDGYIDGRILLGESDAFDVAVSGGTFTVEVPEEFCAEGFLPKDNGDGTYGVRVGSYVATVNGVEYTDLNKALTDAVTAGGDVTVEILDDIDLTDTTWTPVYFNSYNGANTNTIVINGNDKTITGLSDMMFSGVWTGTKLEVNDLTIDKANIVNDAADAENKGVGAIIGNVSAIQTVELNDVSLTNSHVEGGHWTGGLIGYAAGYSGNDGPVFTTITVNGGTISGNTITGKGSVGGVIGHATGDAWTEMNVSGAAITGNTITSTGSSTNKAGSVMGTIGAAGTSQTTNGTTLTGGVNVAATVSGNNVTSNGTAITTIYGRQGSSTGALTVTGGSYDTYPIEENVSYAAPEEGYVIEQNASGMYELEEVPEITGEAFIGKDVYATLAEAIAAATASGKVQNINIMKDITAKPDVEITVPMNIIVNGYTLWEDTAAEALALIVDDGLEITDVMNLGMIYTITVEPDAGEPVAKIGETPYTTVEAALRAAVSGDTVVMIEDSNETGVYLNVAGGIKLDLAGHTLTAAGLTAFQGADVYDSTVNSNTSARQGRLVVAKENLVLQPNNSEVSFWDTAKNNYVFLTPSTSGSSYQYLSDITDESFTLTFRPGFGYLDGQITNSTYMADGGKDNGITIKAQVSWLSTEGDGTVITQTYTYADELVASSYTRGALVLKMTGIENIDTINIKALVVSDAGVVFEGDELTYNSP